MCVVSVVGKSLVKSVVKPAKPASAGVNSSVKAGVNSSVKAGVNSSIKTGAKHVTKTAEKTPKQENPPTKEPVDIHKIFNRSGSVLPIL